MTLRSARSPCRCFRLARPPSPCWRALWTPPSAARWRACPCTRWPPGRGTTSSERWTLRRRTPTPYAHRWGTLPFTFSTTIIYLCSKLLATGSFQFCVSLVAIEKPTSSTSAARRRRSNNYNNNNEERIVHSTDSSVSRDVWV